MDKLSLVYLDIEEVIFLMGLSEKKNFFLFKEICEPLGENGVMLFELMSSGFFG